MTFFFARNGFSTPNARQVALIPARHLPRRSLFGILEHILFESNWARVVSVKYDVLPLQN